MPLLLTDPEWSREIIEDRKQKGNDKYDEVWDGVYVIPPFHDNEHVVIVSLLCLMFNTVVDRADGGHVYPGVNVSDRVTGWLENRRIPDMAVVLPKSTAKDCDTRYHGGPDLAVEIACNGLDPRQKLDFYAKVKTRELLIVNRDPWALELYQLRRGKLRVVGRSDAVTQTVLTSTVLPLTFTLRDATPRPTILVTHTGTAQTWTA